MARTVLFLPEYRCRGDLTNLPAEQGEGGLPVTLAERPVRSCWREKRFGIMEGRSFNYAVDRHS